MNKMKKNKIDISDKKTIEIIQEDFSKMFPYLKIEFISGTAKLSGKTLGEYGTRHNGGFMGISPKTTVAELVKNFYDYYNLAIEVLRHSGKAWLKASKTDYWTLEQQNKLGEELTKGIQESRSK
jgi:hypothetical protein